MLLSKPTLKEVKSRIVGINRKKTHMTEKTREEVLAAKEADHSITPEEALELAELRKA